MSRALVCMLLTALSQAGAQDRPRQHSEIQVAYAAGRYNHAMQLLEQQLADPGSARGPVCYDLGNCAFRLGRYAEAVRWYIEAQRHLPRDARVRHNLALARQRLGIRPPEQDSLVASFERATSRLAPLHFLLLCGALQLVGLLGWAVLQGRSVLRALCLLVVLVGLAGLVKLGCEQLAPTAREAVVLERDVELHDEPHTSFAMNRTLGAGRVVRVIEASDRWVHVKLPEGSAWVLRSAVGFTE